MTTVILLVFGFIMGSFLNVVALRWDQKNFGGRSRCPYCLNTLRWFELVPILSFLVQSAQCRSCGAKISWQYPVIEIWTGLIFLSIFNLEFSISNKLILLLVFCLYVVITVYDFKHKIIPDELVYTSIFLSLLIPLFFIHYSLLDWLSGPILFFFFSTIWLLSSGRAMGFGDAKLGLSVGLLLGATQGFSAIVLAFWIGASCSLAYLFLHKMAFLKNAKGLTMKSEVPFAPFMVLGAWVSLVFNLNLLHVASF